MLNNFNLDKTFNFKKRFGQNFILDTNFIKSMVDDFNINGANVLEIGAGAGTLTAELAENAKQVVSIEIDTELKEHLTNKFADVKNVKLVFADFMKLGAAEVNAMFNGEPFMLVANLPYYITSPIIFKMFEENFNVSKLYIMVQKEMGERIVAAPGTKEYGNISVKIAVNGSAKIVRQVNRKMFVPSPNVDSVILEIEVIKNKYNVPDYALLHNIINVAFEQRRKVFASGLSRFIDKNEAREILAELFNNPLIRGEELSAQDFVKLTNKIIEKQKNRVN